MSAFGKRLHSRNPERLVIFALFALSFLAVFLAGVPALKIPDLLLDSSSLLFFTIGTVLILSIGEIDLSVFGIASLSAITTLWLTRHMSPTIRAVGVVAIVVLLSTLLSYANGWLIIRFQRPSLLITIATFSTFFGTSMILFLRTAGTDQKLSNYTIPPAIKAISSTRILGIRFEALVIIISFSFLFFILDRSKLGLKMKAIGQSLTSATYSGIDVSGIRQLTFILSGVLYGLGTVLTFARFSTTRPSELARDAVVPIMCAVLSGANIQGGRLPIWFPLIGVGTFLCLQQTVFAMRFFPAESYHAVFGTVLLIYILLSQKTNWKGA